MSTKSEAKKAKKMAAIEVAKSREKEIVLWAINQQPEQSAKFITASEGGVTVRMFGRVSNTRSAEVTVRLRKEEALALLADDCPMSELHETVQRVLPFVEYPTVMLSTNQL